MVEHDLLIRPVAVTPDSPALTPGPVIGPGVQLFGYHFEALDLAGATERISALVTDERAHLVVTTNVDHVMLLRRQARFRTAYQRASLRVADGAPVVAVSRLAGRPLPARVTGADLIEPLCRRAAADGWRVALVGGLPDVNRRALERLRCQHPGLDVHGVCPPFGFDSDPQLTHDVLAQLGQLEPALVLLCLGAPRAEIFASEHLTGGRGPTVVCAGAAVDFAAGSRRRAPVLAQRLGLEWLYRLAQEPLRLGPRYLGRDLPFVSVGIREAAHARREAWRGARRRRRS
jgi:N-acetylglucosaminyldiphosphoundecaprenol N-acetyl-beta-D-mannosaminyltransferase